MDIYIGNINSSLEEESIRKIFEVFGEVEKVSLIKDSDNENSKCYAFVKMADAIAGQRAIDELNGRTVADRVLRVSIANQKTENNGARPDNREYYNKHEHAYSSPEHEEPVKMATYTTSTTDDGLLKIHFDKEEE